MPSPPLSPFASIVGVVPGEPSEVVVTEATKSYVVLGWKPPVQRGHEGVMYYIEKVRGKSCQNVDEYHQQNVPYCILMYNPNLLQNTIVR